MTKDSPDPVGDPSGYQRFMLAKLGDDDPAEVQAATPAEIRALVEEAGDRVRTRPEPTEWSVLECLGHMLDAEVVSTARYRWILAEEKPTLVGYDQERWAERLHKGEEPGELVSLFEALRWANVALWRRTLEQERDRVGMHTERGPESYDLLFRLIAGHDRNHLAQARRTLDAVLPQGQ